VEQMDVIVEEGGEEGGEDDEGLTDEYRSGLKEEDGKEGVEEGATPAHYQVNHLLHDILPLCYEKEKTDAFILQIAPFVKRKGVAKVRLVGRERGWRGRREGGRGRRARGFDGKED